MNAKKRGLHRHDVRDLSHAFGIRHRPHCREHNAPRGSHLDGCPVPDLLPHRTSIFGGFHCVCDFEERIEAAVLSVAFDGVDPDAAALGRELARALPADWLNPLADVP